MMPAARSSPPPDCGHKRRRPIEPLPDELLKLIISYLPSSDLKSTALVSRWLYPHASELLWRTVCLTDKSTPHPTPEDDDDGGDEEEEDDSRITTSCDEHDDTPMIHKLFVLAKYPHLASQVQVLNHRCHLPTPTIFSEHAYIHFDAPNLSADDRLHRLLRLAIGNLVNVQTLRIVYGHWHVTRTLLEGFLNPNRSRPIRKLWLESCSLADARIDFGALSNCGGLESLRIRRLRAESSSTLNGSRMQFPEYTLARGGVSLELHDGAGGWHMASAQFSNIDAPPFRLQASDIALKVARYDAFIWDQLPHVIDFLDSNSEESRVIPVQPQTPPMPIQHLLSMSAKTLTSLNLDWILWRPHEKDDYHQIAADTLNELAKLRFPHLRAFQLRNAVVPMTKFPPNIYLLESNYLGFMEAHPRIQCLAWPLDRFYSHNKPSQDVASRCRQLVAHLGNTLVDLRLDSFYNYSGEMFTDETSGQIEREHERLRRRKFISQFAPYMTKLESVKLEGGIPRDEKREIVRALHYCPIKKLVLIGVTFPVGNTWGYQGEDLRGIDEGVGDAIYDLEEEDTQALIATFTETPPTITSFEFNPSYGWHSSPPFLHTIATHHASTIEEMKLCGYNGSPVLSNFLPITKPLLYPLQHFHNLRQLVISLWLVTYFEDSFRDKEIIQSWKDTRSPSSTALVVVTPPATPTPAYPTVSPTMAQETSSFASRPQEFNRWAVALKTRFTPSALAYRVANDIGPYLSPEAKERPGGVRVRASFCIGARDEHRWANDIFDLDIRIGSGDNVLQFIGPREEGETGRWWDKLESRRWF